MATHDRSETTKQRVLASNARDVGILENLCRQADVILSIVPPSAAEEVAHQCLSNEFRGHLKYSLDVFVDNLWSLAHTLSLLLE